jgi:hypothetical protein
MVSKLITFLYVTALQKKAIFRFEIFSIYSKVKFNAINLGSERVQDRRFRKKLNTHFITLLLYF